MPQAPSVFGSLPPLYGDWSAAAFSDSPQATREGTSAMNPQWRSAALREEREDTDDKERLSKSEWPTVSSWVSVTEKT